MTDDTASRYARLLRALGCAPDEHNEAVVMAHHVYMRDRFVEPDAKHFVAALPTDYDGVRALALKLWRQARHAENEASHARGKAHRQSSASGEIAAENRRLRARVADAEAEAIRRTDEIVAIGDALGHVGATAAECVADIRQLEWLATQLTADCDKLRARLNAATAGNVGGA